MKKGSITVYMSLMLTLILSLLTASYTQARTAACRALLANAADLATFSLFAHYDKTLLENYDLFYFDASYQTGRFMPNSLCGYLREELTALLSPSESILSSGKNYLPCTVSGISLTSYTTATDLEGKIFLEQAIDSVRQAGLLSDLTSEITDIFKESSQSQAAESIAANAESQHADFPTTTTDESSGTAVSDESSGIAAGEAQEAPVTKGETDEPSALPITPPDDFTDPRDTIETLRKLSVLDFVCPDSKNISTYQADKTAFLSQRKPFPGMGIISSQEDVTSPTAGLLFNHYLVNHFGCFLSPEGGDGLQYPLEQILMNQNNDYDNLKAVVNRLLLIREGLNIAAIESEPALKSQMQACASTLAALLVLPALEPLIEAFLTAGWAYCESLLDVRTLLSGDKIPTIKNAENWQVALNNLPALLTDPNELKKPAAKGLSYQNYLSILLLTRPAANKTVGAMDMIEHEIRHKVNPDFRFDLCLDSVTAEITATTSDDISLTAERSISYRDM